MGGWRMKCPLSPLVSCYGCQWFGRCNDVDSGRRGNKETIPTLLGVDVVNNRDTVPR